MTEAEKAAYRQAMLEQVQAGLHLVDEGYRPTAFPAAIRSSFHFQFINGELPDGSFWICYAPVSHTSR